MKGDGNLKISKEYEGLVPPLTKEEHSQLRNSIKENGLWVPIVINKQGIILDGHHRFRICKEFGIHIDHYVEKFENKLLEKKYVIECNLKRRHLNYFQKIELGIPLLEIEKKLAKKRMSEGGRGGHLAIPLGKTRDLVSKQIGVSGRTFERAKVIIEKAPEKEKQLLRSGQKSINSVYKEVTAKEKESKRVPLPKGQFEIILADPPWEYGNTIRGAAKHHYSTMEQNQLYKLKIPTAENCVLFLWTTAPKQIEAHYLLSEWGFEYKNQFVWVKDKIGTGFYNRNQHEILFIATKGKPIVPLEKNRFSSVIEGKRTQHSKKPESVYELIEKMYPKRNYLELFARTKRNGWESWGDEI